MMSSNPRSRALARPALARFRRFPRLAVPVRSESRVASASWRRDLLFKRVSRRDIAYLTRIERREETSLGRHDAKSARKSRDFSNAAASDRRGVVRPPLRGDVDDGDARRRSRRDARSRDDGVGVDVVVDDAPTRRGRGARGARPTRDDATARRSSRRARIDARARAGRARGRTRDADRAIADAGRRTSGKRGAVGADAVEEGTMAIGRRRRDRGGTREAVGRTRERTRTNDGTEGERRTVRAAGRRGDEKRRDAGRRWGSDGRRGRD